MKACVISCIFGKDFNTVHKAVKDCDSYFFSNNPKIEEVVKTAGWKYIFIDFPLSDDYAESSFQSKYIKFLQFVKQDGFFFFNNYDIIIYADHKRKIEDIHIRYLISELDDYDTLIRCMPVHAGGRKNIWEEVAEAIHQERYLRFIQQTIDYIREKLSNGYSENPPVPCTGLIAYRHTKERCIALVNEVYNDLKKMGTSECQIVWAMVAQKYTDIIKIIDETDVLIKYISPSTPENNKLKKIIKLIIKIFIPYGLILLWQRVRRKNIT